MPLNEMKIVSIILEQSGRIEQRCSGYRKMLIGAITEIMRFERDHRVSATNIQQKVNDKCSDAGRHLDEQRSRDPMKPEEAESDEAAPG